MVAMTESEQRRLKDIRMLENPDRWPNWPICPVKRWNNVKKEYTCGVVWSGSSIVLVVNMFLINGCNFSMAAERAEAAFEYVDIERMVDDGWQVD